MAAEMRDSGVREASSATVPGRSRFKANRKIIGLLVGSILLVSIAVAISILSFTLTEESAKLRRHTNDVIVEAGELLSTVKDAETGQRGYLLTGDDSFLEPYVVARENINRMLEDLRSTTSNVAAAKKLDAAAPLVKAKLKELAYCIELRRNHQLDLAVARVSDRSGKQLMDSIRAEFGAFIQIEQQELTQQRAESRSILRHLFAATVVASALTILLSVAGGVVIYREAQQQVDELIYQEAQQLLKVQQEANRQLWQANLRLKKNREQLRAFIQHAPVSMAMFDMKMNYLAASDGWLADRGLGDIDIVGRNHYQLIPELPAAWKDLHQQGLAGAALQNNEEKWVMSDGSVCWLRWALQPWLDENGAIGGIIIAAEDISESKAAQLRLRESEAFSSAILDSVTAEIAVLDREGTIVAANQAWRRGVLEHSPPGRSVPNSELGTNYLSACHIVDDMATQAYEGIKGVLEGRLRSFNLVYPCDSAEQKRWFHMSVTPLEMPGAGVVIAHSEKTASMQAEAALQLSHEKLRDLVAHQQRIKENERIRIAREIHDELGSALTAIKANLSVAIDQVERTGSTPNPRLQDACALLDSAVETVRRVIADLRPSVLDNLGVWAALEWYAGQIQAHTGIACRFTIDPSVEESSIGDERSTELFRILQETLTNVTRHANASQVEIRLVHEERAIRMEVEDNGLGIDEELTQHRTSWGIAGMVERARSFGGNIRISNTSHGTLVSLRMPLEAADA